MAYKDTTEYGFGQLGSMFIDASGAAKPPTGKVFVAITFLADTKFDTAGGLIINFSNVFPRGITIYGRYSEIDIASGSLIAYIGE